MRLVAKRPRDPNLGVVSSGACERSSKSHEGLAGCQKSACPVTCGDDQGLPCGIMIIRVLALALPHLRPGLRLAGPARPVIGRQGRRAARAAARGRRAAPYPSAALTRLGRPGGPRRAAPVPAGEASGASADPIRINQFWRAASVRRALIGQLQGVRLAPPGRSRSPRARPVRSESPLAGLPGLARSRWCDRRGTDT